jgi:hypothetical protein
MNKLVFNLASDAVIFVCFYLWRVQHIDAAREFLTIVLWMTACILVIGVFVAKKVNIPKYTALPAIYAYAITAAEIGLMVWSGMTALAAITFIAWVLIRVQINADKETA